MPDLMVMRDDPTSRMAIGRPAGPDQSFSQFSSRNPG